MGFAVFQVMALKLWRDRGALLLAFLLPSAIYVIFAAIFANASGGELDLRVALARTHDAPASVAFAETLAESPTLSVTQNADWTLPDVRDHVRLGMEDVGVVVTGDVALAGPSAITVVTEPSREVASRILKGQLRQILADQAGLAGGDFPTITTGGNGTDETTPTDQSVSYYIGAVGIMFLLFSAMQASAISLEERDSGISDRLLLGMGGALRLFSGKFMFLASVGFFQVASICAVAQIFFEVPITNHLLGVGLACVAVAIFAAGFALFVASLCRTSAQMHAVSTFLVLLLSAVGGSMVPRFMMPDWLQGLSRLTPNGWAIDAFYGILARGQTVAELWLVWSILLGGGALFAIVAAIMSQRLGRV